MKKLLLTLTATLLCAGAFGQGKLGFDIHSDNLIYFTTDTLRLVPADRTATADNGGGAGPFPIAGSGLYTGPGSTIAALSGSPTIIAALYAGSSSNSLSLQATTTIGDATFEGLVEHVNLIFSSIPAGTPAWFQVQVFDSRADASSAVINGVGGGAADAWAHANLYAGVSQIFQATPSYAVFAPIYLSQAPVNSTWAPGTFPVVDMVQFGPGYYGGIEVYANTGPPPPQPQIISQPMNATNHLGQSVTFTVSATGDQPLWYQWQAKGTNLSDGPNISGSATNQLSLSAITLADVGSYRVIITNYAGSVTSRVATLTLAGAPSITQQPSNLTNHWGQSATFTVSATGDQPLWYQWQANGTNLSDGANISGSATNQLSLSAITLADVGSYRVIVTNYAGSVTSGVVTLTLLVGPGITGQPASTTNHLGQSATFTVTAFGEPPLRYQWQANGTNLSDGPNVSGSATNQLTLNAITPTDAGSYRVIITNYVGSVTSRTATLTLEGAPSITEQPVSQLGYLGKSVTFRVTATGDPLPSYQWQKDSAPIPEATDTSLVLTNLQATNGGRYRVIVSNPAGSVTSSNAYLTIRPADVSIALHSGITIEGAVGQTYGIQCSTNLDNTNGWWGLTNLTLQAPVERWLDAQPAAQQPRYYLVVPGPISIP